jgi:tetratricopeptide (TPR) repeat protein
MYRIVSYVAIAVLAFMAIQPAAADDRSACRNTPDMPALAVDEGIAACSRLLIRNSRNANLYNVRGLLYDKKKDREHAIADYSQAIALSPRDATLYTNRADSYYYSHEYDRAIADADQAIRLNPKAVEAYNVRGLSYEEKGDDDRALGDFSIAIALDPGNSGAAYNNRANIYDSRGDYDHAIADLGMAISLAPKEPIVYSNRGRVYGHKGDYDRSISDLSTAISLDPNAATPYSRRGFAYAKKGSFDRAMAEVNKSVSLDPKNADTYAHRAAVEAMQGNADRAIADADAALRIDSKNGFAYNWRGKALFDRGEYDRAIADFDKALKLNPGASPEARDNRARAAAALAGPQTAAAPPPVRPAVQAPQREVPPQETAPQREVAPPREAVQRELAPPPVEPAPRPEPPRVAAAAAPGPTGRRALVIGIDSYPGLGNARLERAAADAEAVGDQLAALGFQVMRLTTAKQGSLNGLLRGVDEFRHTVGRNDLVVLYFAGYGMGLSDGTYLAPSDVSEASLEVEATARRAAISESEITEGLQRAGAAAIVAVIDARHSDAFAHAAKRVHPVETEGVFKLYAASEGQAALDGAPGDGAKTSVFARAFIKAIATPGLDLNRLGVKVRDEVYRTARAADRQQTPAVYDKLIGSTDVYFAGEARAQ